MVFALVNPAQANERGVYLGLGGGLSRLSPETNDSPLTLDDNLSTALGVFVGYDLTDRISVELGYTDLGSAGLSAGEDIGYSALSAGAVAYVFGDPGGVAARDAVATYLRLGVSSIDNQADIQLAEENNTSIWAGVGVEWPLLERIGVRGEIASFDSDAQAVMVSFLYRPRKHSRSIVSTGSVPNVDQSLPTPTPTPNPETAKPTDAQQPEIIDEELDANTTPELAFDANCRLHCLAAWLRGSNLNRVPLC